MGRLPCLHGHITSMPLLLFAPRERLWSGPLFHPLQITRDERLRKGVPCLPGGLAGSRAFFLQQLSHSCLSHTVIWVRSCENIGMNVQSATCCNTELLAHGTLSALVILGACFCRARICVLVSHKLLYPGRPPVSPPTSPLPSVKTSSSVCRF